MGGKKPSDELAQGGEHEGLLRAAPLPDARCDADHNGDGGGDEPLTEPHGAGLELAADDRRDEGDDADGDLPPPRNRGKGGGALHGLADVPEIVEGAIVEGGRGHVPHHATTDRLLQVLCVTKTVTYDAGR